ncbi:MAG: OmpA family protein [Planctomycetes bacterium]|nr:OmpA family protein [Planctomycetota bacterium]
MKHTWMIAALLCAAACVSPEAHKKVLGENEALRAQIDGLTQQHKALAASYDQLDARNKELGARAAETAWITAKKAEIDDLLKRYQAGGSSAISGVELVNTAEGLAFRVAGGVLFAPGKNELTEQGKRTLTELASSLGGRQIRIDGHTDDQKIQHSRWGTNLRLSVERAMSVADFLTGQAGLAEAQVNVAGYAQNRPAVEGSSDDARATNRRVEILLLER